MHLVQLEQVEVQAVAHKRRRAPRIQGTSEWHFIVPVSVECQPDARQVTPLYDE